jgi:hypothetical protein
MKQDARDRIDDAMTMLYVDGRLTRKVRGFGVAFRNMLVKAMFRAPLAMCLTKAEFAGMTGQVDDRIAELVEWAIRMSVGPPRDRLSPLGPPGPSDWDLWWRALGFRRQSSIILVETPLRQVQPASEECGIMMCGHQLTAVVCVDGSSYCGACQRES